MTEILLESGVKHHKPILPTVCETHRKDSIAFFIYKYRVAISSDSVRIAPRGVRLFSDSNLCDKCFLSWTNAASLFYCTIAVKRRETFSKTIIIHYKNTIQLIIVPQYMNITTKFIMQNTGKRCVILLVFIILRWSFNYESNVFRYNHTQSISIYYCTSVYEHHYKIFYIKIAFFLLFQLFDYWAVHGF
jgi:hypothetical protein